MHSAAMMVISGLAWVLYSITGQKVTNAAASTAGNFILAAPIALIAPLLFHANLYVDLHGFLLGVVAGAITSGAAYLLWYSLLPILKATTASTLQLSIPCLATLGGVLFLGEALTLQVMLSTAIILTGIGMTILADKKFS
ncbi:DMT family transporter [Kluyvera sp. SCKS090646]|uniref:DMT family transporter n=2 Tax=Kluyvera sichuanensis TaxID=2725494 RepID=A0ABR6RNE0_9ENTR|nr:DMT family transporter [Kluyvera sichuanensis]